MQRKGVDIASRIEEGRTGGGGGIVYSSNYAAPDDDRDGGHAAGKRTAGSARQGHAPAAAHQQQGWSPIVVLLVGAVIFSMGLAVYMSSEATSSKAKLRDLELSLHAKQTEFSQVMAATKHRVSELDSYKAKAEEREKLLQKEIKQLHEGAIDDKHKLHEEEIKFRRMHRDNVELHKRLKVKSAELKILEEQTHSFEAEMSRLTKAIHTLQGDTQADVDTNTDYEVLYKKQEEQRKRAQLKDAAKSAKKSAAEPTKSLSSSASTADLADVDRGSISDRSTDQ